VFHCVIIVSDIYLSDVVQSVASTATRDGPLFIFVSGHSLHSDDDNDDDDDKTIMRILSVTRLVIAYLMKQR